MEIEPIFTNFYIQKQSLHIFAIFRRVKAWLLQMTSILKPILKDYLSTRWTTKKYLKKLFIISLAKDEKKPQNIRYYFLFSRDILLLS